MSLGCTLRYTGPIMKYAARWTAIIALFAIPFLPLYVSNELFFPFITGKGFVFRILVEVAFAAYAVLAIIDKRYRPKFSWVAVIFAAFVLWMGVANSFGVYPVKAFWSNFERMDGWITLVHLLAFFVVTGSVLAVEKLWRRWWFYFVSVAAVVCGYGLLQIMGVAEIHQGGVRVDASFGNAIYLAVYLMFSIFAAGWLAMRSRGWIRHSLISFIALAFVILFYTASRGALIGLVAGAGAAGALWLFLERKDWKDAKSALGLKVVTGLIAVLVLVTGVFFLARDSAFVQGEPTLARLSTIFSLNQELRVRSTVWGMAFQGVSEDPLTGWGQEGFNQVFNKYYDPSLYAQESWFDRAHSMYLDWLVAGGIPALILFVVLLLAGIIVLLRMTDTSRAERALLTGALVAYAVQALVVFDNLFSYVPLVMLLAMAHAESARRIPALESMPELRGDGQYVAGAGLAVAGIVLVWSVNVPSMQAAHHLVYAASPTPNLATTLSFFKTALADGSPITQEIREQLAIAASKSARVDAAPAGIRTEFLELAVSEMEKEVAASPNDARLRVQYASALESAGQNERSLEQLDAAIALSPRKQVLHINKGYKLYELGRLEEARSAFRYAYELDHSFEALAISAAAGQILAGDVAAGKALLMEALGTTTPPNETMLYAYYEAKLWTDFIAVARAQVVADGGAPAARFRLAKALAAAGRLAEARAEITAIIAEYPDERANGEALLGQIFSPAR